MQRLPDADDESLLRGFAETTVCVVADEPNLASLAAQAAVTTVAGLVLACGMRVRLVMPAAPILGYQPPLIGEELTAALAGLGGDSVPGAEAAVGHASQAGDLVFVIGDTEWRGVARQAWRLTADAWCGRMVPTATRAARISTDFPIGALVAATAAAAEPYRAALRSVAEATGCAVPEPWQLQAATSVIVRLAQPETPTVGIDLGSLDLVSGGALTTATLHALLRVEGLVAAVRVWEPQALETSNLNRYVLLRRSMIPMPKVRMLESWQRAGLTITGYQELVDEAALARAQPWAPWVFVGTDNVEARWLVQGSWPEHLVVAGTAGFMVLASEHDRGRACAGCLHAWSERVGGDVPTVSFVSYLGGLLAAARLLRWAGAGAASKSDQATEAWADRLDGEYGYRHVHVPRIAACPVGCYAGEL
jgi:hypothetical protein